MSPPSPGPKAKGSRVTEVVVLTTAMLTFISFWRASAIVLCDLASTAYYIGGIVEQAVGKAAPWFILAVMLFSYAIRAGYMESCSMFVRGGVYKVVKEAMGGTMAKLSVSALIFDYVLTGPCSAVSAGQYLVDLLNELFPYLRIGWHLNPNLFAVLFAVAGTVYFWRVNIQGIPESGDKALKIMHWTTGMAVVMMGWCIYTLVVRGAHLPPFSLHFSHEALGWTTHFGWLKAVGAVGIVMAFGHSILAMSGEETLAQVYRELESPKIVNLKKAGFIIFLYSLLLTSLTSFFAVMIIPDSVRIPQFGQNLLGGLAMWLQGPFVLRLAFHAFVVAVGGLILMGAVNTSIVGSYSVLNRVAEDGVLVDWFRGLHPKYGTTHRTINLVAILQIITIILCWGDVYLLGEAYAFGVVWSFVFKTLSLAILRFTDRSPREFEVPLNIRTRNIDLPVGIMLIFGVLLASALMNLLTKKTATIWGMAFTLILYALFRFSEAHNLKRKQAHDEQREKLNLRLSPELSAVLPSLKHPQRTLIALHDSNDLYSLRRTLQDMGPATDLIVFHSKSMTGGRFGGDVSSLGPDEEMLFSNVIHIAEKAGKTVVPVMVVSNDSSYAIAQTALAVGATEVVMGISHEGTEAQVERLAMIWGALGTGSVASVKVTFYRLSGYKMQIEI